MCIHQDGFEFFDRQQRDEYQAAKAEGRVEAWAKEQAAKGDTSFLRHIERTMSKRAPFGDDELRQAILKERERIAEEVARATIPEFKEGDDTSKTIEPGVTIKLTPEQWDFCDGMLRKARAATMMAISLGEEQERLQSQMWDEVYKWYPELRSEDLMASITPQLQAIEVAEHPEKRMQRGQEALDKLFEGVLAQAKSEGRPAKVEVEELYRGPASGLPSQLANIMAKVAGKKKGTLDA